MIRLFKVRMSDDAPEAVGKVLRSGYIGEGPKVKEFEQAIQLRFGNEVVATNSATSAEHLAYHLLKVEGVLQEGDEVLATPLTCTATNWPILANGLKIKWVDVDPTTMNMDLDDLARKITPSTKAISIVHWGGYPVDMLKLNKIVIDARDNLGIQVVVLQDCAHALGSRLHQEPLSVFSHFSTYSFQAIKHLTCGDGGALVLSDPNLARRAKLLRWYGIDREGPRTDFRCESDISNWGFKFHMNDISASIGLANLSLLDDTIARHQANAAFYNDQMADFGGVTLMRNEPGFDSAYWIYTLRVDDRADFMMMMKDRGIEVSRVHDRNDKHSCVREYRTLLPNLEVVCKDMICIPVGWWVTEEERQYIVDSIKAGW